MVLCQRRGCGVDYVLEAPGAAGECQYHPGAPVFHEGLKSWSCCKESNKPVMEFDQFLALPGCARAPQHTREKQDLAVKQVPGGKVKDMRQYMDQATEALNEVQLADSSANSAKKPSAEPSRKPITGSVSQKPATPKQPEPEASDPDAVHYVAKGTQCRRRACNYTADTDISQRDRSEEKCMYHPGTPIFHEGSKGYTCCKRRVLDFDDFLQITPCTPAKHGHLFVPPAVPSGESVQCRMDHYETPDDVRITVYAKSVNSVESQIQLSPEEVQLDLQMDPVGSITHIRRFQRTLLPYALIDPEKSSYTISKMKVDLVLVKAVSGQTWPALERGDPVHGYGVTFGNK
ncbi:hypothetical protein MYAM1_002601 [Malassezia yamatoensis]|uniref:Cysteine and histidine-rich domain-containing protein 1 n=1 Tax=Malassezia yamatoensis TaxID=253288 RepID=A0AAJ5YTE1_9BASI|nr:hypothetical protein MYAM1_002601 [Malassezia yamatoensis]